MTYSIRTDIFWKSLLLIFVLAATPSFGATLDSLRTEQIDGKLFIIHQVDQGETLYAISRRYKVSVPNIISHNPSAKLDLEVGAIIRVPLFKPTPIIIDTTGMKRHQVKPKETLFSLARLYEVSVADIKSWNKLTSNDLTIDQVIYIKTSSKPVKEVIQVDVSGKMTHVLQQGETLYSLSKKYTIDIDQIRTWNNLQDNTLSIGQLLIVGDKEEASSNAKENSVKIDTVRATSVAPTVPIDTISTTKRVENIHGFEEVIESGIGELIPGSTESRKYLGLHHTAKIGTIMKVRNEMNNKMVFVRIIGRIPNTGDNKKVLIKISKAAYDRLSIIDPRFRIEVSYMP